VGKNVEKKVALTVKSARGGTKVTGVQITAKCSHVTGKNLKSDVECQKRKGTSLGGQKKKRNKTRPRKRCWYKLPRMNPREKQV